jgi:hypothetical protein
VGRNLFFFSLCLSIERKKKERKRLKKKSELFHGWGLIVLDCDDLFIHAEIIISNQELVEQRH